MPLLDKAYQQQTHLSGMLQLPVTPWAPVPTPVSLMEPNGLSFEQVQRLAERAGGQ